MAVATGTPNTRRLIIQLNATFPDWLSLGVWNCRKISGSESWSQHAYGNGLDITSPHYPHSASNPEHMAYMDDVVAWIGERWNALGVRQILWRTSAHWDHAHVDFWPKGAPLEPPPCVGGDLVVYHIDGTTADEFVLWSHPEEEDMSALFPTHPDHPYGETGTGWPTELRQKQLNRLHPDNPLTTDGVFGDATKTRLTTVMAQLGKPGHSGLGFGPTEVDLIEAALVSEGPPGPAGPEGPKGDKGAKGDPGPKGDTPKLEDYELTPK